MILTSKPQPTLLLIPKSGSSTAHPSSIVLEHFLHIPLLPVEPIVPCVRADLEHCTGRLFVIRISKLSQQLREIRETSCVDIIVFINGEIVGRISDMNDVDESKGVVGLKFEYADCGCG